MSLRSVQNRYNLVDREDEALVDYCEAPDIGFIPWFPLGAGDLARPGGIADRIANAHGVTAGQMALAWILSRTRVMLPIAGTSKVAHLEESVAAAALKRTDADMESATRGLRLRPPIPRIPTTPATGHARSPTAAARRGAR